MFLEGFVDIDALVFGGTDSNPSDHLNTTCNFRPGRVSGASLGYLRCLGPIGGADRASRKLAELFEPVFDNGDRHARREVSENRLEDDKSIGIGSYLVGIVVVTDTEPRHPDLVR